MGITSNIDCPDTEEEWQAYKEMKRRYDFPFYHATPDGKLAQRHYISDVADNNMSTFFKAGNNKSPNHPFFLNWLNRNAPAIGTGITVGTTLNNYINNE